MAHAENQVTIIQPVEVVFDFLVDGLNNPKWRNGVVRIALKSGSPGLVGTEYSQVLKGPGGRDVDGDYRLTAVEPGRELAFVVTAGPVRPTGIYRFEAVGARSTQLTFIMDFEAKGLKKIMGPMIQKAMQSEVESLDTLKRVLEASG